MILRVERISKAFGGKDVLQKVDLDIEAHVVCGIVGGNGSGKTTLFDIICGFQFQDSGSIYVGGMEISRLSAYRRGALRLGLARTFQTPRVLPGLSVLHNALAGYDFARGTNMLTAPFARAKGEEVEKLRGRVMNLLEIYGLEGKVDASAYALSFGQKKRLEVVRAVLSPAKVFLFDEPFAGIESSNLEQFATTIVNDVKAVSGTLLLIDHRIELVAHLSDRVFRLEDGELR